MIGQPKLESREPRPYLGIRASVKTKEIGAVCPGLHNQLADWMESRGIQPSGAPFFRYLIIDPESFEMEVGVPVAEPVPGAGSVIAGVLPGGNYAIMVYTGHFSGLFLATQGLLKWGEKNEITWQMGSHGGSEAWEARLETYLNVGLEKNPEKWQTEIAILTADESDPSESF